MFIFWGFDIIGVSFFSFGRMNLTQFGRQPAFLLIVQFTAKLSQPHPSDGECLSPPFGGDNFFTSYLGKNPSEFCYDQKRQSPRQYHNQNKRSCTARRFRTNHQGTRPGIDGSMEKHDQQQAVT
jgi:hypothetical protein